MQVRLQADADLNQHIVVATIRRLPSIDFQTAAMADLARLTDLEVLRRAASDRRILVSHDQRTMPHHFAQFILNHLSPGLLIVPQSLTVAAVAADLILITSATDSDEWIDRIVYLPL